MWMRAALCSAFLLVAVDQPAAQEGARSRASVDFKGGTLRSYVDAVRAQLTFANIVIDGDELGGIILPSASLRTLSLPQALEWVITTAPARRRGLILQRPSRSASDTAVVWVFTVAQAPVTRPVAAPEVMTQDHAVDSIPGRADWPETLRLAVDGKLGKRNPRTGSVEYIARGRLLRVTGNRQDLQDADQTVAELEQSVRPVMVLPQMQAELNRLRQQVDSLKGVISGILSRLPPARDTTK